MWERKGFEVTIGFFVISWGESDSEVMIGFFVIFGWSFGFFYKCCFELSRFYMVFKGFGGC